MARRHLRVVPAEVPHHAVAEALLWCHLLLDRYRGAAVEVVGQQLGLGGEESEGVRVGLIYVEGEGLSGRCGRHPNTPSPPLDLGLQ